MANSYAKVFGLVVLASIMLIPPGYARGGGGGGGGGGGRGGGGGYGGGGRNMGDVAGRLRGNVEKPWTNRSFLPGQGSDDISRGDLDDDAIGNTGPGSISNNIRSYRTQGGTRTPYPAGVVAGANGRNLGQYARSAGFRRDYPLLGDRYGYEDAGVGGGFYDDGDDDDDDNDDNDNDDNDNNDNGNS